MDASLILTRAAAEGTAEGGGGGKAGHMPSDCRGRSQSIGRQASNAVRLAPSTMLRMVPLPRCAAEDWRTLFLCVRVLLWLTAR